MPNNQETITKTTHERKSKNKTKFKAVINKALVSSLVLSTLVASSITPAFATDMFVMTDNGVSYRQNDDLSIEQSIAEIKNTIDSINQMKANATVTDDVLQKLSSQIYALGQSVQYSSEVDLNEVSDILDKAEIAVSGLSNANDVRIAVVVTRGILGLSGSSKDDSAVTPTTATSSAGFADVNENDWFYTTVTQMTEKGLFKGKGNNLFCPNDTMTRAEFITVACRILYPQTKNQTESDPWWFDYYALMVNNGVIDGNMFGDELDTVISREEMAYVAVRTLRACGDGVEIIYRELAQQAIPDYSLIDKDYAYYVEQAYSEGILCGVDANGTFNPKSNLTRAEAATVLYRMIDLHSRTPMDFIGVNTEDEEGHLTIYEGEVSERRFAREGDTFIKADGTVVVLKKGPHGILGEGQGIAPDLGVVDGIFVVQANNCDPTASGSSFGGGGGVLDSSGDDIKNQCYYVNELTGEGHWSAEWRAMTSKPLEDGTFNGQLSEDLNWYWSETMNEWICVYVQDFSDSGIVKVLELNGLR